LLFVVTLPVDYLCCTRCCWVVIASWFCPRYVGWFVTVVYVIYVVVVCCCDLRCCCICYVCCILGCCCLFHLLHTTVTFPHILHFTLPLVYPTPLHTLRFGWFVTYVYTHGWLVYVWMPAFGSLQLLPLFGLRLRCIRLLIYTRFTHTLYTRSAHVLHVWLVYVYVLYVVVDGYGYVVILHVCCLVGCRSITHGCVWLRLVCPVTRLRLQFTVVVTFICWLHFTRCVVWLVGRSLATLLRLPRSLVIAVLRCYTLLLVVVVYVTLRWLVTLFTVRWLRCLVVVGCCCYVPFYIYGYAV